MEQYLVHHGIRGQKWGIRRYQNPDGTLTEEGKERYGISGKSQTEKGLKREARDFKKALRKTQRATDEARRSYIMSDAAGKYESAKRADKLYKEGKKEVESLLKDAEKAGLQVDSKDFLRMQDNGELMVAQMLFGLPGNIIVTAIEMGVHNKQKSSYEGDSMYGVQSKKYKVRVPK